MKAKKVYYDCQVCGKKHLLKVKWGRVEEKDVGKFHEGSMEAEARKSLLNLAEMSLSGLHPGHEFDVTRLEVR